MIERVEWSPDGTTVAARSFEGKAMLWDTATGAVTTSFDGPADPYGLLSWVPNSGPQARCANDRMVAQLTRTLQVK